MRSCFCATASHHLGRSPINMTMTTASHALLQQLLPLSFFIFLVASCCAVSDEEVGNWDWYQKYIGRVKHAVFHTSTKGKKQVLVATQQNVVASLSIRNGEIIWRQVLGDSDKINGLDTASGKYVITFSGGNTLRAWSITSGQLIWETCFPPFSSPPVLDVTPIELHHLQAKMILVFGGPIIYGVSSADGEILWTTNTSNASQGGMFSLRRILTAEDKNSLYGVGFTGTSGFSIWKVYLFTGRLVMQEAATVKENLCTDELIVTKHTVIALDCEGKTIFTGHIGPAKSFFIHRTPVRDIVPDALGKARLLKATLEGVFSLRFIDQIVFIRIGSSDHDLKVLEIFERPAVISNSLELPVNKTAVMLVQHVGSLEDRKVAVRIILKEGERDETFSDVLELEYGRGLVQQVHLSGYIRTDRSCGFRALLIMEDYSLLLVQNHEILWAREDGLATILDVAAVELPKEKIEEQPSDVDHSLREWFKGHFQKLMALLKGRDVQDNTSERDIKDRTKLIQDDYGFRKLLVVLTEGGKLLALHTGDGRIVWSLLVPSFQKSSRRSKAVPLKLFLWHHPADLVHSKNPVVLVIGKSGTRTDALGILAWVDIYTGNELHSVNLPYAIEDVLPFTCKTSINKGLYLLTDVKKNVVVFPWSQESLEVIQHKGENLVFPMIDVEKGVVSGFGINWSTEAPASTEIPCYSFRLKRIWKVDFSQRSEKILATSREMHAEAAHASTKIMIDESDSCGVVNKMLMVVATASISVSKVSKRNSSQETDLAVYVMDVGTGRILHHVQHLKTQGRVHVVNGAHWFAYHYFDLQAHKYKVSALEILGTTCEEYQNVSAVTNVSAFNQSKTSINIVRSDTIMYSHSIKTMTIAEKSSSNEKHLLIGTVGGQIIFSDITALHHQSTTTTNSNFIMQWIKPPLDTTVPQLYLTRADPVEGLRKIVSMPTELVSRSLVFAYGVDIFFTHTILSHTTPSHLKEYSILLLLVTIGAMVMAILVTRTLSKHRRLKKVGKHG